MSTTIWGSFDGASTAYIRPYIEVSWTQNLANNTSKVTASLYFHRYTNNYWSYNEMTNSNGHSCTFRIGNSTQTQIRPFNLQTNSPPNRALIWTRTQTVSHNSAGNATVYISASGNTNVNPQHYDFGKTITLPQIPRETTINSVSIDGTLSPNTTQGITLSVSRKHSSYTMDYQIYAGSKQISNTTGQDVRTSLTLTSGLVNSIILTMPKTTTRTLQLRVITRDSSGKQIGTTQTKNFSVSLNNTNTRPTLTNIQANVAGSGTDSSKGIFVQGISRLYASFVTDAGYGASIKSRSITVSGQSFGSQHSTNSNRYDGNSSVLNNTGSLTVTYKATNSRDQTRSVTRTITVLAYSPPRIESYVGSRSSNTPTTISVTRKYSWNTLNSQNKVHVYNYYKTSTSSSWTAWRDGPASGGSITSTISSEGHAETISWDFKMVVEDEFGNSATSIITVSTAKVLMSYNKDIGVGIGKIHERGALDIQGEVYINGEGFTTPDIIKPTLENGFGSYSWGSVGYTKIGGIVHLNGMITVPSTASSGNRIFLLPEGYRPNMIRVVEGTYGTTSTTSYRIDITTAGTVRWNNSDSGIPWVSLNNISFPVGG